MEFIEATIYVKLSDEERNSLHEVYVILNDYGRFDLSQAAEICRVFAPAEKLEISN